MFEELEEEDPDCYALLQYKKFKQAAGKTAKSIMIYNDHMSIRGGN